MVCKERFRRIFLSRAIVALAISAIPSFPQVPTGTIGGAVLDQSEAVIQDAKVIVLNRETGAQAGFRHGAISSGRSATGDFMAPLPPTRPFRERSPTRR